MRSLDGFDDDAVVGVGVFVVVFVADVSGVDDWCDR